MAKRHVSAYFLDEKGKARGSELMADATATDGFLVGEVDDDVIARLQQAGLIVQTYPESWKPPEPEEHPNPMAVARQSREALIETMDINPAPFDYYRVVLRGPVIEAWRQELDAMGVKLGDALPHGGYRVMLQLADVQRVRDLAFVASVDWIQPIESAPTTVTMATAGPEVRVLRFDIRLISPDSSDKIQRWLMSRNVEVVGASGRKIRISAAENDVALNDLATLPEVDTISEYVEPKVFNDVARQILNIDELTNPQPGAPDIATLIELDGKGQIVAVADTGIDDKHPDFTGRIAGKVARGRPNDTSDPHGHGTHVAGSVLGDGTSSGGKICGTAPKAKLFFQSLLDSNGGLGGLPLDVNDLFAEAYASGARIHNNSWGAATPSSYTMSSEEVDEFVRKNPDMLIVIAAGNSGTSAKPLHAPPGFVDWLSIGSPGSSKNSLTVGASRSSRSDGSATGKNTWGRAWPNDFPNDPVKSDPICGDIESMAAFSSRGPIDDHRIKPDVVAPGTDILSTLSEDANIGNFWGPGAPNHPKYAYDGGTSMATPLVSGCAALIRQHYVDVCDHPPSAALLKATLVNSTVWLKGKDAVADTGMPNYHQGFGRVSMTAAIPNKKNPQFTIRFIDDWQRPQASLSRTGERRRYFFALPANTSELRFCLAYTDAPARGLQNNVNLIVQHVDSGIKWVGNSQLPEALTPLDTTNNVESIRIPTPPGGNYVFQIVASNLLKPPQDFAVVISGDQLPQINAIT